MSRWIIPARADLKATAHGHLVDRADTTATGGVDPVVDAIAASVARVRLAVSAGNQLDVNPAKVPASLKHLTVRMAIFVLMERIGLDLSEDQRSTRREDNATLKMLAERKVRTEEPDEADVDAVPQNRGTWNSENKLVMRTNPVPAPGRQRGGVGRYANPDAPEDRE